MELFKKIGEHHQKQLPFVAYKKPDETKISAFFQQTNTVFYTENYTESGFVFTPFNTIEESVLIPKNKSEFLQEEIQFSIVKSSEVLPSSTEKGKEKHLKTVKKAVDYITEDVFKKVVISRKEVISTPNFNSLETFKRMLLSYSKAMVYIWFHPKIGLWLGATPETLVNVRGGRFTTMSLAGTQEYKGTTKVNWKPKELDEQQVVTDYIVEKLKLISTELKAEKVTTIKAGNLLHLQTKIAGKFNKNSVLEIVKELHPTPAVCGFPKEKAKEFILKNEGYKREFYTGFLGELNLTNTSVLEKYSNLFVNLRCVQVVDGEAFVYVGGGITKNSNPIKEWEETVAKAKVMKRVL